MNALFNMKTFCRFLVLIVILVSNGCNKIETKTAAVPVSLPNVSAETEAILRKEFPGIMPVRDFTDSLIQYITDKYGIHSDKMLLGVSMCVDDIIYTKNFHAHPEIKGPFHLGGLAGLPFTGISGLEAFAHHVPEGGTMVLMVEPHIGYSEKKGWGFVLRHEQHEASSCCGALMGTLGKLQKGTLKRDTSEEDYQGGKIAELALHHEKEIRASENPILALTRVTSAEAERQIRAHVLEIGLEHVKYIIIITGVLINTDFSYSDYEYVSHIMVYDVQKKMFVEELKNS